MEIVKATTQEFDAIKTATPGTKQGPLRLALNDLAVDEALRLPDHEHKNTKSKSCQRAINLRQMATAMRIAISIKHDGPDLLVMRIK